MTQKQGGRIAGFDGLRAIAIIGIVLYHLFPDQVPGGFLGVPLFFSIMGYLLVYSSWNELRYGDFNLLTYFAKKIRRLYPPLIIVLLMTGLFMIPLWPRLTKGTFPELQSVLLGYNNWWQISQNSSYFTRIMNASPLTHLWYLALTMQYYLIWPAVFLIGLLLRNLTDKEDIGLLLIAAAIVSAVEMGMLYTPGEDPSRVYYGTDTRAFSVLLGMALALFPVDRIGVRMRRDRYPAKAVFFGCLVVTAVLYLVVNGTSAWVYRGVMFAANIVFIMMMFFAIGWQKHIGIPLDGPLLKWIGSRSYMIYLLMFPVIYFFSQYFKDADTLAMKLAALAVILVLAEILWRIDRMITMRSRVRSSSQKRAAAISLRRKVQSFLVMSLLMASTVLIAIAQTERFEASHDTSDMAQLEKELAENAALLAEQSETGKTPETKTPEVSAMPVQTELPEETPEPTPETTPTPTAEPTPTPTPEETGVAQTTEYTAIGDSVMLGAYANMRQELPMIWVDAAQSRHTNVGVIVADSLYQYGHLGPTVIIHLGTNSRFDQETGQKLIDYLGPDRTIYWMTCRGPSLYYINDVNDTIRQLAEANSNVSVLDWQAYSAEHYEWFYSDGIHLNPDGRIAYTHFIADQLGLPLPVEEAPQGETTG